MIEAYELDALKFLAKGPDKIGIADSDEKIAAYMCYGQLVRSRS